MRGVTSAVGVGASAGAAAAGAGAADDDHGYENNLRFCTLG